MFLGWSVDEKSMDVSLNNGRKRVKALSQEPVCSLGKFHPPWGKASFSFGMGRRRGKAMSEPELLILLVICVFGWRSRGGLRLGSLRNSSFGFLLCVFLSSSSSSLSNFKEEDRGGDITSTPI